MIIRPWFSLLFISCITLLVPLSGCAAGGQKETPCDVPPFSVDVAVNPRDQRTQYKLASFECHATPNEVNVHVVQSGITIFDIERHQFNGGKLVRTITDQGAFQRNSDTDMTLGLSFGAAVQRDAAEKKEAVTAVDDIRHGSLEAQRPGAVYTVDPPLIRTIVGSTTKPAPDTDPNGLIVGIKTPSGHIYTTRTDTKGRARLRLAETAAELDRLSPNDVVVFAQLNGTMTRIGSYFLTDDDVAFAKRAVLPGAEAGATPTTAPSGQQLPSPP